MEVKCRTELETECDILPMPYTIRPAAAMLLLLFLIQRPLFAQEEGLDQNSLFTSLAEWAYGQDQELVNGLQYYNRHPRSLGHPYLHEGLVHQGSVNLRGKLYTGLWLRYNIHEQYCRWKWWSFIRK